MPVVGGHSAGGQPLRVPPDGEGKVSADQALQEAQRQGLVGCSDWPRGAQALEGLRGI